jgi:endonuclease G
MKKLLIIAMILLPLMSLAQAPTDTVSLNEGNFHTAWSSSAKYPVKVSWKLTAAMLSCPNPLPRCNCFQADPNCPHTTLNADYSHSGYDQGHNFDADDDACTPVALNKHCWYFTNMAAQLPNLNRITWKNLESQCRRWAKAGDNLFIECGSYGHSATFGHDNVWAPAFCWKVVHHQNGSVDAYIMPNVSTVSTHPFAYYHTTLAAVELATGLRL